MPASEEHLPLVCKMSALDILTPFTSGRLLWTLLNQTRTGTSKWNLFQGTIRSIRTIKLIQWCY